MTFTNLSNASYALKKIEKLNLPFAVSRKIFFLIREINSEIEFYVLEENKLLEKHHAERTEDGKINFQNPIDLQNYVEEMKNLNSTEVEISGIPLILSEKDFDDVMISPETLINLEGIIEFE